MSVAVILSRSLWVRALEVGRYRSLLYLLLLEPAW